MLNQIFISDAFAQTSEVAAAAAPEFSLSSLVPLLAIFAIFYFLIVRPQSKKMKDHQIMVNSLKVGNKVVTSGGIIGVVKEIHTKDDQVEIEISNGVNIRILKNFVSDLVQKESEKTKVEKAKVEKTKGKSKK